LVGVFVITTVQKWIAGGRRGPRLVVHRGWDIRGRFLWRPYGQAGDRYDVQRFHDTGRAYMWEFLDPLSDGSIGYARFRFSYASLLPEAAGRPVFFEGMSCFRFRDGLIAHYGEAFDRGVALVQLDFSAVRIKHILARAATAQNRNPETKRHFHRFSAG